MNTSSKQQPLIILTCMRSFSSLISTMLGQHSGILGLPEINPFIADTMGEIVDVVSRVRPRTLHGLLRTIAHLQHGRQDDETIAEAKAWLAGHRHWRAVELFDDLAERAAPQIICDKSPSTVLRDGTLQRAISQFPEARFLHLYRHPVATTKSIAAITEAATNGGAKGHLDPESSWYSINHRIISALAHLPAHQVMSVRGEDVLASPEVFLTQISDWLGLETTPDDVAAMLKPEESPFAVMGPSSARFGNDVNFLRNPKYVSREIDLPPLSAPLEWAGNGRKLTGQSVTLAHQLGYV